MAQGRRTVAHSIGGCAVVAGGGDPCDYGRLDMTRVYNNLRWVLWSERWCSLRYMGKLRSTPDGSTLTDKSRI